MSTELEFLIRRPEYPEIIDRVPVTVHKSDDNKKLAIESGYHAGLVEELRCLPNARWNPDLRVWTFDNNERAWFSLTCLVGEMEIPNYEYEYKPIRNLYPHQELGVRFVLQRRRCILAYKMGLGKTLIGIETMDTVYDNYGFTDWWLVAPPGAQRTWNFELSKWNADIKPLRVTTYESLHKLMKHRCPDGVIFDESVKIKNKAAQRSQVASELCRNIRERAGFILMLSGAPAPRDPTDWWHQVECLQPGFIREPNPNKLKQRLAEIEFRDGEYGRYPHFLGWKDDEIRAFGKRLSPLVLVQDKKQILNLPDKVYDCVLCEPTDVQKEYAKFLAETSETAISLLQSLRQLSDGFQYDNPDDPDSDIDRRTEWIGSPKLDAVIDELDRYEEEPGRLVVYAYYKASVAKIAEEIRVRRPNWNVVTMTGDGWSNEDALDVFNMPYVPASEVKDDEISLQNCPVVIVANPAVVHGLNLQRTHALVYYSNDFNTDSRLQSEDRRDRIGMDIETPTRVVDLCCLSSDKRVLDVVKGNIRIQELTLDEIKKELGYA